MPRDHKTPLIKKITNQACITYRVLKSSDVADSQSELIPLLTALRAADLKIAPRKSKPCSGAAGLQSPTVTHMHICETEVFSMGVFLLRPARLHAAARPPGHERESTELLIRKLPFQRIQLARRIRGHRA
ncbi:unnamed protein product [Pleuronectes platessa]|uniref:Uncharacterized protein n=1 Tax=Pleuronectes platessa TaxID=8262 RepID=A0A9N7V0V1_PLEPL|nr:unnamed protein product [Pleuronectes platessa]